MKKFLTFAFILATALPCLATSDTLSGDSAFIAAVKKAKEAGQKAKDAERRSQESSASYKQAVEETKKTAQELKKAGQAYDEDTDPKARNEALKAFSLATDKNIKAIDKAAIAEAQVQKAGTDLAEAKEELKLANQRASELDRKLSKR